MSAIEFTCVTEMNTEKLSFSWVLRDFHSCLAQLEEGIYSSPFPSQEDDEEWCFNLIQHTADDGQDYLYLGLGYAGARDVRAEAVVFIVNASGQESNKQYMSIRLFRGERNWCFCQFIRMSALEIDLSPFLLAGNLRIRCELTVIRGYVSAPGRFGSANAEVFQHGLSDDLGALLDRGDLADVTIQVVGGTHRAHKAVLAARSPVFRAMFSHEVYEAQGFIKITDMDYDVLGALLRFIYTGRTPQLAQLAGPLFAAADKYFIPQLRNLCEEALIEGLDVENAPAALILADQHNAAVLRRSVMDFICAHGREVTQTPGWDDLVVNRADLVKEVVRVLSSRCSSSSGPPPN
ncbi:hypothetical protein V5799_003796 [Amblyomma americanum]|uniref:BTB domain-containing protein n=1 Tax=Amblyomma americanum TaxID=6943 RepID=A0AAQ4D7Y1_AMBAM